MAFVPGEQSGYIPSSEEIAAYLAVRLSGLVDPSPYPENVRAEAAVHASIVTHMPAYLRGSRMADTYFSIEVSAGRLVTVLRAEKEGLCAPIPMDRLAEIVQVLEKWRISLKNARDLSVKGNPFGIAVPDILAQYTRKFLPQRPQAVVNPNHRYFTELAVSAIAAHQNLPSELYVWAITNDPIAFASNPILPVLAVTDPEFLDAFSVPACSLLLRAACVPASVVVLATGRAERAWEAATQDRRLQHSIWLLHEASRLHVSVAGDRNPTDAWDKELADWYHAESDMDAERRFRKIGRQWMLPERDPELIARSIVTNVDWTARLFGVLSRHLSPSGMLGARRIDILRHLAEDGNVWVRAAARRRLAQPGWTIDPFLFREEEEISGALPADVGRFGGLSVPPMRTAA